MDQNIIILILILIAILVSFYSAYLAIDNSKKIRRLQVDIRNSLGTLNDTLNIHPPKVDENQALKKQESRTNLNDLNQFPSLEEINNYDELREKEKNLEPLDENLKQEMDETLETTENNIEEIAQEIEDEMFNEIEEYEKIDKLEEERNIEPQVEVVSDEVASEVVSDEVASEVVSAEVVASEVVSAEVVAAEVVTVAEDLIVEELNLENEEEVETDLESISVDVKKDDLPQLNELTQEILSKMPDKTIKEICRRENIKLRGTKSDRIKKILDLKEFQVNL